MWEKNGTFSGSSINIYPFHPVSSVPLSKEGMHLNKSSTSNISTTVSKLMVMVALVSRINLPIFQRFKRGKSNGKSNGHVNIREALKKNVPSLLRDILLSKKFQNHHTLTIAVQLTTPIVIHKRNEQRSALFQRYLVDNKSRRDSIFVFLLHVRSRFYPRMERVSNELSFRALSRLRMRGRERHYERRRRRRGRELASDFRGSRDISGCRDGEIKRAALLPRHVHASLLCYMCPCGLEPAKVSPRRKCVANV